MEFIHNNPFRILGLPIDSSEKDIVKRVTDLEAYTEIGKKIAYEDDFPILSSFERTPETIREAANRIETSESRFFYTLFWFWKNNSSDELALDVLKDGNVEKAVKLLEGQFSEGKQSSNQYSTAKNLAILYLAISRKNGSYDFERFSKGLLWSGRVLEDNLLAGYAKQIGCKHFIFEKQKAIGSFIDEVVKTVTPYIDEPSGISLPKFVSQFISFSEETRRHVSLRFVGKHIKNIEDAILFSETSRQKTPENAGKLGTDLYNKTSKDLNKLKDVLSSQDFQYQSVADKLANEIADCSIYYFNYHTDKDTSIDPGEMSLKLARCAYSIAVGLKIKQRVEEGIPIIEKWVSAKSARDKRKKIKYEYDYIVSLLNNVPDPDELPESQISELPEIAKLLVNNSMPKLKNIRSILGADDESFIELTNAIANNAMNMCIHFANEKDDFNRVVDAFKVIGTLLMETEVLKRYEQNFNYYKKQAKIKNDIEVIIRALSNVPDTDKLDMNVLNGLPQIAKDLIACCKPRLTTIKTEDYETYINISSAIVNNALGMCIDYANKTHDMTRVLDVMRLIGEFDMELSLKQRYDQNFQIMMNNWAAARTTVTPSGGCYIATMVYGSYEAPEVQVLRKFRDSVLAKCALGQTFIRYYYRMSPGFVERYQNRKTIHIFIKWILDLIVRRLV